MIFQKKASEDDIPSNVSTTIIAAGTCATGDFDCSNHLRIDGQITGNILCESKVVIGQTGLVKGAISCCNADITGTLHGDVVVTESLILRKNAVVIGNITANMLQMEPGVQFNGQCVMGPVSAEMAASKKSKKEEPILADHAN
jgi:cytoskeletal protein CcmA (bactofilin family)